MEFSGGAASAALGIRTPTTFGIAWPNAPVQETSPWIKTVQTEMQVYFPPRIEPSTLKAFRKAYFGEGTQARTIFIDVIAKSLSAAEAQEIDIPKRTERLHDNLRNFLKYVMAPKFVQYHKANDKPKSLNPETILLSGCLSEQRRQALFALPADSVKITPDIIKQFCQAARDQILVKDNESGSLRNILALIPQHFQEAARRNFKLAALIRALAGIMLILLKSEEYTLLGRLVDTLTELDAQAQRYNTSRFSYHTSKLAVGKGSDRTVQTRIDRFLPALDIYQLLQESCFFGGIAKLLAGTKAADSLKNHIINSHLRIATIPDDKRVSVAVLADHLYDKMIEPYKRPMDPKSEKLTRALASQVARFILLATAEARQKALSIMGIYRIILCGVQGRQVEHDYGYYRDPSDRGPPNLWKTLKHECDEGGLIYKELATYRTTAGVIAAYIFCGDWRPQAAREIVARIPGIEHSSASMISTSPMGENTDGKLASDKNSVNGLGLVKEMNPLSSALSSRTLNTLRKVLHEGAGSPIHD